MKKNLFLYLSASCPAIVKTLIFMLNVILYDHKLLKTRYHYRLNVFFGGHMLLVDDVALSTLMSSVLFGWFINFQML